MPYKSTGVIAVEGKIKERLRRYKKPHWTWGYYLNFLLNKALKYNKTKKEATATRKP